MQGKTILITGGNTGIGFETAKAIAKMNGHIIITCRTDAKCIDAQERIKAMTLKDIDYVLMDLASVNSIREAVKEIGARFDKVDVLVNNAGIATDNDRVTVDYFPEVVGVNHLGPFLFTAELLGMLSDNARIVNVASLAYMTADIDVNDLFAGGKRFVGDGYGSYVAYSNRFVFVFY